MFKVTILAIALFSMSNSGAQTLHSFVDSSIEATHVTGKDWAIGFYTEQGGYMPIYDSLGNVTDMEELFSTIVIYNIKNEFYLQRFSICDSSSNCYHAGKRVLLPQNVRLNFTADSIRQASGEWVYQYIYKNDEGAYVYQEDSPHSPYYVMHFATDNLVTSKYFTDICINNRLLTELPPNLNEPANKATFIYSAFIAIKAFISANRKLVPVD
jgi:hypothetical protein